MFLWYEFISEIERLRKNSRLQLFTFATDNMIYYRGTGQYRIGPIHHIGIYLNRSLLVIMPNYLSNFDRIKARICQAL